MKSYSLGNMSKGAMEFTTQALHDKSFMNFKVEHGRNPGGYDVTLFTDYEDTDNEILTMALFCMAHYGTKEVNDHE
jgi:hypothetical protein